MTNKKKNIDCKKCKIILKNLSKNYWAISTVILSILFLTTFIFTLSSGEIYGATISAEKVGQKVLAFANDQGANAELISVNGDGQFYEVILSIRGEEIPVYATKDGESLIPSLIPLTAEVIKDTPEQISTEVPKSDKPITELFIMTHCPYGTQAEKGFVPLLESFDKADAKIRFVHYFMHEPEETETPRQICIREEQPDKFLPYLREFLKEGISEDAMEVANIDVKKMNECISSGKWEEYYNVDKALSESYGVGGSPTLVIDETVIVSNERNCGNAKKCAVVPTLGRDSASYLSTICSAFNDAPEECGTLTLSSTAPSPMWGWDTSGSNSQAQC